MNRRNWILGCLAGAAGSLLPASKSTKRITSCYITGLYPTKIEYTIPIGCGPVTESICFYGNVKVWKR